MDSSNMIETKKPTGTNWNIISIILISISIIIQLLGLGAVWLFENKDFGDDPILLLAIIPMLIVGYGLMVLLVFGICMAVISIAPSIVGIIVNLHPRYSNHKYRSVGNLILACICLFIAVGGLLRFIYGPNTEMISTIKGFITMPWSYN